MPMLEGGDLWRGCPGYHRTDHPQLSDLSSRRGAAGLSAERQRFALTASLQAQFASAAAKARRWSFVHGAPGTNVGSTRTSRSTYQRTAHLGGPRELFAEQRGVGLRLRGVALNALGVGREDRCSVNDWRAAGSTVRGH